MKLKCIQSVTYHWGIQLVKGKEYEIISYETRPVTIITDEFNYYEISRQISGSLRDPKLDEFRRNEIHERNNNLLIEQKKYEKTIDVPFVNIKGEESVHKFITLSKEDIFNLGCDRNPDGRPTLTTSNYFLDEYFETISAKRTSRLDELGI